MENGQSQPQDKIKQIVFSSSGTMYALMESGKLFGKFSPDDWTELNLPTKQVPV